MVDRLEVGLGERTYPIAIGPGVWRELPAFLADRPCTKAVVVTDDRVRSLYGGLFTEIFSPALGEFSLHVIREGEASKSFVNLESLCRDMARSGLDRRSLVVALGGGVVGDLAGLAASVYLRGVRLVQLPTTLLSMVDSSVGGKTGINIVEGKNLVGTFYQPEAVFADTNVLATLHERDWYSGLAEVIKIAITLDAGLFDYLESVQDLSSSGPLDLTRVIAAACRNKAQVVEKDEKEAGLRKVLNFGHTLGHGVEAAQGYGGIRHGEAVILGMRAALNLSLQETGLSPSEHRRAMAVLDRVPLPEITLPEDIAPFMTRDKKSVGNVIEAVLIEAIGRPVMVRLDEPRQLVNALREGIPRPAGRG